MAYTDGSIHYILIPGDVFPTFGLHPHYTVILSAAHVQPLYLYSINSLQSIEVNAVVSFLLQFWWIK